MRAVVNRGLIVKALQFDSNLQIIHTYHKPNDLTDDLTLNFTMSILYFRTESFLL